MKNTGKPSEEEFDDAWARLGKKAFVFKFTDAAEARGRNRAKVHVKAQPSDRLVTHDGETFYAEVKSTHDLVRFPFSLLRTSQGAFAAQVLMAGGRYEVFVHAIEFGLWYRIPYTHIQAVKAAGQSSIKWIDLGDFHWKPYTLT